MKRILLSLLLVGLTTNQARSLTVTSIAPGQLDNATPAATDIVVDFDATIDTASVHARTFRVFGRWSGPRDGVWTFENGATRVRFTPAQPFFRGEWVTVSLSRDVVTAGGDSLTTGYAWNFWVDVKHGTFNLPEIDVVPLRRTGEAHIQSYGAYAGDLNHDGWSDLTIPNELSVDLRICLNDGSGGYGGFTVQPIPGGASPSANEGADFDGDGHIDIAVAHGGNNQLSVHMGNGTGVYTTPVNYTAGNSVRGVAITDIDADGDDDIVTASRQSSLLTVFYNDGAGVFDSSLNFEAGANGETAVAATDVNGDGILDIIVGAYSSQQLVIMLGDGQGNLTPSDIIGAGGRPWMVAVGDIDGDGDVDVASANSLSDNTSIAFCDGTGGFDSVVVYPGGQFTLAVDLGDIDGDGDLDLVTSHFSSADVRVWENDGTGVFTLVRKLSASSAGSCAILHDRDNDGDMDISTIDEVDDLLFLYENVCPIPRTGDMDQNGVLTSADIIALVNFVFKGGTPPAPCNQAADNNCDGSITSADVIYMVNHIFKGGPQPCEVCECP